ncbi:hypothetical protein BJV78DRAFT_1277633 [Lactifluus subvellereus]|nr:hypothetical protein BJV78DRAFT_1277633 [Lactifluus subvellereus]
MTATCLDDCGRLNPETEKTTIILIIDLVLEVVQLKDEFLLNKPPQQAGASFRTSNAQEAQKITGTLAIAIPAQGFLRKLNVPTGSHPTTVLSPPVCNRYSTILSSALLFDILIQHVLGKRIQVDPFAQLSDAFLLQAVLARETDADIVLGYPACLDDLTLGSVLVARARRLFDPGDRILHAAKAQRNDWGVSHKHLG